MVTRIKICGITRQQDADAVVDAGADALGFVFAAGSPRQVSPKSAAEIARRTRGAIVRVGLFVNAGTETVSEVLESVELDVLQFHGEEPPESCRGFGLPYMKAFRMREPLDLAAVEVAYHDACCFLLDAFVPGIAGGTGMRFDWNLWPKNSEHRLVLAGGLTVDNVADAVTRLRPWGVDVSGGVEGSRKGVKDARRIRDFISEVRRAGS